MQQHGIKYFASGPPNTPDPGDGDIRSENFQNMVMFHIKLKRIMGAQWLSGRVLDSRPRGRGFEPHRRHCVVSLSKSH